MGLDLNSKVIISERDMLDWYEKNRYSITNHEVNGTTDLYIQKIEFRMTNGDEITMYVKFDRMYPTINW